MQVKIIPMINRRYFFRRSICSSVTLILLFALVFVRCTESQNHVDKGERLWNAVPITGYYVPVDSIMEPHVVQAEFVEKVFADCTVAEIGESFFSTCSPLDTSKRFCVASPLSYVAIPVGTNHGDLKYIGGVEELYVARSLCRDSKGNIWIGSVGGLSSDQSDQALKYYSTAAGLNYYVCSALAFDNPGKLWIGYGNGAISYYSGDNIFTSTTDGNAVLNVLPDSSGNVWVGKFSGAWFYDNSRHAFLCYTTKQGLAGNCVQAIYKDRASRFWFATTKGLTCHDPNARPEKKFRLFRKQDGLANENINCVTEDKFGNIWFGGNGGGLACMKNDSIMYLTVANGMHDDTIRSLMFDSRNNLWVGGSSGITQISADYVTRLSNRQCCNNDTAPFEKYSIHGMCVPNAMCEDGIGRVWIGTSFGTLVCTSH